jgi:predicted Zn-dependent protease
MRRQARIVASAAVACLACLLLAPPMAAAAAAEKAASATPNLNGDFQRCRAGAIDSCYDAIRWRPSDPSLLSALGDAQLRANRPADALKSYQRVAVLAPNMPGVTAKITSIEAKLSAKRTPANSQLRAASVDSAGKHYSNAAPETQSH